MKPAETTAPTQWIDGSCRGEWWTVGAMIPDDHEALVRVDAPEPTIDDWWAAYRDLFGTVAAVGARHTSAPGRDWFAI